MQCIHPLLLLLLCVVPGTRASVPRPSRAEVLSFAASKLVGSEHKLHARKASRAGVTSTFSRFLQGHSSPYLPSAVARANNATVNVVDFGADPTGRTDSTKAFVAALTYAITSRNSSTIMGKGIMDLGQQCFCSCVRFAAAPAPMPPPPFPSSSLRLPLLLSTSISDACRGG